MTEPLPRVAMLADPHFHDVGFSPGGRAEWPNALRSFADTAESTRIFNESWPAFHAALDDIVRRGIKLVAIVGDLTDDGQAATMSRATALVADYAKRHGIRFFATPGNHDLFAMHGRHQAKAFLTETGSEVLVTSDPDAPLGRAERRIVTEAMYCHGYPGALAAMAGLGFFRDPRDLHWESPFGADDRLAARTYGARSADGRTVCEMIDASYLVEPVAGLWLLSIDANVFVPRDGATDLTREASFFDSTDAGWRVLVREKPFLLRWMSDVARRAERLGKQLIAFSHYPALEPLDGTVATERALFGNTSFARRSPDASVADAVAATGIKVHFSGHLHVNDTARHRQGSNVLLNVAVPSTVGFPAGYKIVSPEPRRLKIETVGLPDVQGFDLAFPAYRSEAARHDVDHGPALLAHDYGSFLSRHLGAMVSHRYLPREWPAEMAALVPNLTIDALVALATSPGMPLAGAQLPKREDDHSLPFLEVIGDWYRLRKGSQMALDYILPERLAAYDRLQTLYGATAWPEHSLQGWLAMFFGMLGRYRGGLPSRDFSIDLRDGEVFETPPAQGRTERRHTGTA